MGEFLLMSEVREREKAAARVEGRVEAARRLLAGLDRTGFFTQAHWVWWVLYREGEAVFAQEHILVPEALREPPYDPADPYRQIGDRVMIDEDGRRVSEWRLELGDVRDFVARRAGQYVPA